MASLLCLVRIFCRYYGHVTGDVLCRRLDWNYHLSGIIGVALALSVFIPLKDVGKLYAIIATLMFSMMITDSVTLLWGQYPFYLNGYLSGIIRIGMIAFPVVYFTLLPYAP